MTDEESKLPTVPTEPVEGEEEEIDVSPFMDYLQSPQGHEIASRLVGIIEEVKKVTLDKNFSHAKFNRWMEAGVIVVVIGSVVLLSIMDKLNPTVGMLLGSVVGYFFGRHKNA
ncbi:hypothetical protein [Alcanivorax sp.]|jgi:hypothetical protein|uniref:hypothetical protein n=1 Tax=Alcanivorax sp. TaxID=1872427 RepID=UPI0025BC21AA|nr:hypothetical protein [Alcanivorax sp.]